MENTDKCESVIFVSGNRIPFINEIISSIVDYAPTAKTKKQGNAVIGVVNTVYEVWIKVFKEADLIHRSNARSRLKTILQKYELEVRFYGSTRIARRKFFKHYDFLFNILKPNVTIENESLHIFYQDQNSLRKLIIEDVELEFKDGESSNGDVYIENFDLQGLLTEPTDETEFQDDEESPNWELHDIPEYSEETDSYLAKDDLPCTPSGLNRTSYPAAEAKFLKIPLRKGKFFQNKVKECLALGCVDAGTTINQGRKFFVSVSRTYFGQDYVLEPQDGHEIEEEGEEVDETHELEPPCKRPYSNEDYEKRYSNVAPSYKSVYNTMHTLAIVAECNMAVQLLEKGPDTKAALHYDTTSRRKVQGELTSLVLVFSNGRTFRLRPFNIAKETRQSIADFFVAEIRRIAMAAEVDDPAKIWNVVDSIMTDAASKNLGIEAMIADQLGNCPETDNLIKKINIIVLFISVTGSSHRPYHLLCNTHVCEAFDRGNLIVIKRIETLINLKEILISNLPELKSFLLGKTCTEAALLAFTKIAMNTGHPSSLYLEFEKILVDRGRTKKFSLLKERRFCVLGYTAAAILYHLEDFRELLRTTKSNNLLVLALRVYIDNEFLLSCFAALANFNYHVTFPYFYFCEKATQELALDVFPRLQKDLECKKVDTLKDFAVNFSFHVREMETEIETAIMDQFCIQASRDFKLQKGREYGFNDEQNERATDLTRLSARELEGLPLNNMVCERDLGKRDHLLQRSAKTASKNFKGLGK
jgi:hypothetical protein